MLYRLRPVGHVSMMSFEDNRDSVIPRKQLMCVPRHCVAQLALMLCRMQLLALVVAVLACVGHGAHYEVEDGVYIALDDTLEELITTTDYLLVEFCACCPNPPIPTHTRHSRPLVRSLQAACGTITSFLLMAFFA